MGISGNPIDTDLIASNIKSGVTIFGVDGSFEGNGSDPGGGGAIAGYMLNNINGYNNYMHGSFDWLNIKRQHETSTHMYYCYEAYFAGGGGSYYNHVYILKINKITKVSELNTDTAVYYETSGGSQVAASLSWSTDGNGNYRGLYSDDGQLDFSISTDVVSPWSYGWHSHNKVALVGGIVAANAFTPYGGGIFRLKVYTGINYTVMRQYRFLEIQ